MTSHKKTSPLIVAIVLTWNSEKVIAKCLHSLEKSEQQISIIVVDNNSSDRTRRLIHEQFPKVKIVNSGSNLGYAGGNNFGIKSVLKQNPEYIFILNPDAQIALSSIGNLRKALESDKSAAAVSPKIYRKNSKDVWYAGSKSNWFTGSTPQSGGLDIGQFKTNKYTDRLNGCAMLMRTGDLVKVGMLDERFFLYYEEADLSVKFSNAQRRNLIEDSAVVWHDISYSTGGELGPTYHYYMTRNRLLFVSLHKPYMLIGALFASVYTSTSVVCRISLRFGLAKGMFFAGIFLKAYKDFFLKRLGHQEITV